MFYLRLILRSGCVNVTMFNVCRPERGKARTGRCEHATRILSHVEGMPVLLRVRTAAKGPTDRIGVCQPSLFVLGEFSGDLRRKTVSDHAPGGFSLFAVSVFAGPILSAGQHSLCCTKHLVYSILIASAKLRRTRRARRLRSYPSHAYHDTFCESTTTEPFPLLLSAPDGPVVY